MPEMLACVAHPLRLVPILGAAREPICFGYAPDAASPHQMHDYVIYFAHEEVLMGRYEKSKSTVMEHVGEMLPRLNQQGQRSLDIMQRGRPLLC